MDLCTKEDSAHITVNALELVITSASIDAIEAYKIDFDEEYQTATLHWNKIWNKDLRKTLHIVFNGRLNENLAGFYRGTYQANDGKDTHMGLTQFQATDCRRAFPCWDEPALKATFDITITSAKGFSHLSNMPARQRGKNPWKSKNDDLSLHADHVNLPPCVGYRRFWLCSVE